MEAHAGGLGGQGQAVRDWNARQGAAAKSAIHGCGYTYLDSEQEAKPHFCFSVFDRFSARNVPKGPGLTNAR